MLPKAGAAGCALDLSNLYSSIWGVLGESTGSMVRPSPAVHVQLLRKHPGAGAGVLLQASDRWEAGPDCLQHACCHHSPKGLPVLWNAACPAALYCCVATCTLPDARHCREVSLRTGCTVLAVQSRFRLWPVTLQPTRTPPAAMRAPSS